MSDSDSSVSSSPSSPETVRRATPATGEQQEQLADTEQKEAPGSSAQHQKEDALQAQQPGQGVAPADVEMDALSLHLLADQAEDKEKETEELARLIFDGDDIKHQPPPATDGQSDFAADFYSDGDKAAKEAGLNVPDFSDASSKGKGKGFGRRGADIHHFHYPSYGSQQQQGSSLGNGPYFDPDLELLRTKYEFKLAKKKRDLQWQVQKYDVRSGNGSPVSQYKRMKAAEFAAYEAKLQKKFAEAQRKSAEKFAKKQYKAAKYSAFLPHTRTSSAVPSKKQFQAPYNFK
eukprot:CAMPEP_0201548598 /NCGR_PEP_ID=MMETSP0173_2-20130828/5144_1 /ASSEMBLY_ACC=CAM_ASM_000268 /TAXON_ID=218659 /ORGANISM="Vexillifera sp., Strain DIVA3 564/2" /LENGTH=288 /DNA_ID=CAMNT_0047958035 /DNA_START=140 /DNA_END=1006 /DNA_ORIENTATION=+